MFSVIILVFQFLDELHVDTKDVNFQLRVVNYIVPELLVRRLGRLFDAGFPRPCRMHITSTICGTFMLKKQFIRRSKKTNMFSVLPLWKKGRRRSIFYFIIFSKWPPDTFSKITGRPIFSRWPPDIRDNFHSKWKS